MNTLSSPLVLALAVLLHSAAALTSHLEADQGNWTVPGCILVRMAAQVRTSTAD